MREESRIVLRDYQQECVNRVLNAYEHNPHATELIVLPTAGGKTIVFSSVIDELNRRHGLNTLIIAHRDELLNQAADKYRLIKPQAVIGKVGSGIHQYGGEVTVASIATISRPEHLKKLMAIGYGLIIVDEAHHVATDGYQRVLDALPDAFKLFVTATPDRLDNKPVLPGKTPLYTKPIIPMVLDGYLCNFRVIACKTQTSLDVLHTRMGDYTLDELEDAIDTPARNKLIVEKYKEHTPGERAVAFCVTVSHAEHLRDAFNEAGIPAAVVEGETPIPERDRIYTAFRKGEILVMTNVMVLSEGWDEPLCSVGIGARPTQSRALWVQQFGRILRLAPGKSIATWLDITDNCLNHRLQPMSLGKAIGKHLKDKESLIETVKREQKEAAEREAQVRKLRTAARKEDIALDLIRAETELKWTTKGEMFVLEVGKERHRIALVPSDIQDNLYSVWARLSPFFDAQQWASDQPLDWAQNLAERKAKMLLADPTSIGLIDRTASWRNHKIDPDGKQVKFLEWKKIPWNAEMTKGEAADLIDEWKRKDEQRKSVRKMRRGA